MKGLGPVNEEKP